MAANRHTEDATHRQVSTQNRNAMSAKVIIATSIATSMIAMSAVIDSWFSCARVSCARWEI
ncbi:hypothetical protein [Microbacterium sp. UCD-TDU]|uniref:hypothetical protein n=1 Tax=Microbacterium sp. UCD-TDU TaxID=1247714 RepID=UPI000368EB83|nr:hypothetical protein [Microbacterium sp. UCD-TDU]EYT57222.1 hypothetical protein D514_0118435 [Microbacterium sp. UCD-TDU]